MQTTGRRAWGLVSLAEPAIRPGQFVAELLVLLAELADALVGEIEPPLDEALLARWAAGRSVSGACGRVLVSASICSTSCGWV
jgi:hypothetical protein